MNQRPFTHAEAVHLWARLVAGWAYSLDASGARALLTGEPNREDAGGSYEGVTRMLWGLGGWLSHPERPTTLSWHGDVFDLEMLARRALVAGVDPESPGFWGWPAGEYDQRTVESGQVAFVLWQTRAHIWDRLAKRERASLVAWLERCGRRPSRWRNNWALFWALNHAARKALGVPYDQATIDSALEYLDGVYCGDGWYDDAERRGYGHFDDYNWWVFTTHVLAWIACDGDSRPDLRLRLLERVERQMAHLPCFFAADGGYAEYGRSLSYKFARLGAPLLAYSQGAWPHAPGMLRRLVGRHLRWYVDRGALHAGGTLRQSLTAAGSLAVRETYISTGAVYWAMLAFAGLWRLADHDPFWSAPEQPLPIECGDFVRIFPQPGWVVVGDTASGAVHRYNAGSSGSYPAKYDKFFYATDAPFNVGLADGMPSPDSMVCLSDGRAIAHRAGTLAFAVGEPGWLRMRYVQEIGGGRHMIDTTIVVHGSLHVRAHRITLDPAAVGGIGVVEGSAPLGFAPGSQPVITSAPGSGWEWAATHERAVGIARLRGYDGQQRAAAWRGRADLNSIYGDYVLPLLTVSQLEPAHELVCLAYAGAPPANGTMLLQAPEAYGWRSDGAFFARWSGEAEVVVPALPAS
ncbi:MAG: DUF2264 domain-containing protein [Chloroflexi bacterium]|nr:DUF2264 domain-containing protein [Chloroflexota bacterium]